MKFVLFISLGITTVVGQEIALGKSASAVQNIDSEIFPLQRLNGYEVDNSYPLYARGYRIRREAFEAVDENDHIDEDLKGAETGANPYPYLAYRSNLDYQRYGYPNYRYQPNRHRYWG
ncbi:uncharacterized protein LOC136029434 [Artemia franciscana]|uniref:uncharacterized protein LOC136029434 n=1 Tax=Artemia franciscana TaxID=6661 RepID=UPI0032DB35C5